MYPKGSPKHHISQLSTMGKKWLSPKHTKRPSPKYRKKSSPKGRKERAIWNAMLEKSLVDILHEHDNAYHRGQNGWSGETWSAMVDIFHNRNQHVKFAKTQVHDKEKELKRDYKMLNEARKQSGVGWNESEFKLEAEPHLWENLAISFGPKILKFKNKRFPLYNTLGDLYQGHLAEGKFNFTSNSKQSLKTHVTDIESGDDESEEQDLQILDRSEVEHEQVNNRNIEVEHGQVNQRNTEVEHEQVNQRNIEVEHVQVNQRKVAGPSTNKCNKPKRSPKKSSADGLVGVMERFVKMKEKEANHEALQDFSITKCIAELRNLQGFDPTEKARAFVVFKSVENREIFLNSVNEKDGTALIWLRIEMDKLT
uniref:Uncharacterized protein n=1 Tax=Avena sativa TaxID=4498 RepID=A0ACD5VR40_AVESA